MLTSIVKNQIVHVDVELSGDFGKRVELHRSAAEDEMFGGDERDAARFGEVGNAQAVLAKQFAQIFVVDFEHSNHLRIVLDSVAFFGLFGVVPAVDCADKVLYWTVPCAVARTHAVSTFR